MLKKFRFITKGEMLDFVEQKNAEVFNTASYGDQIEVAGYAYSTDCTMLYAFWQIVGHTDNPIGQRARKGVAQRCYYLGDRILNTGDDITPRCYLPLKGYVTLPDNWTHPLKVVVLVKQKGKDQYRFSRVTTASRKPLAKSKIVYSYTGDKSYDEAPVYEELIKVNSFNVGYVPERGYSLPSKFASQEVVWDAVAQKYIWSRR